MTRVDFILPTSGGGGGAHSVVQEATAMRALGVEARILVNAANHRRFRRAYARFDWLEAGALAFDGPAELARLLGGDGLAVATTNASVHDLADARPDVGEATAYYVQDYEPLFYEPGTESWHLAISSYGRIPGMRSFAKTRWLCGMTAALHGADTALVRPSLDHGVFHPGAGVGAGRRLVLGMVRPTTPRRAPARTLRVMARLAARFGDAMDFAVFGATEEEMAAHGLHPPDRIAVLGPLGQADVGVLMRRAEVFLDLSDYQAFGRSCMEAMACGVLTLGPALGGLGEFVRHGENGLLVDTADDGAVLEAAERLLDLTERERRQMRLSGIEAAAPLTPLAAAVSELRALGLG